MTRPVDFLDLTATTRAVRDSVFATWSDLVSGNRFVGDRIIEEFEAQWAAYCGTPFAIGVANGTDALQLTLRAMRIGPGDEVVVPANSFVATAEGVVLAGATPCFADVDPATLLMTADRLEEAITPRTRAAIVVHLYGQMPDLDALMHVANRHGIELIEDAAQAHGASWRGRTAGSFGTAGCFSFYPGKNLGAFGDAGAVVTSDEEIARRLRSLRDHGRVQGSHYDHALLGTNSRLDSMQAAVLLAKLPFLLEWNLSRRRIVARYRDALADAGLDLVDEAPGSLGVYHLAVIRVRGRERARRMFASMRVDTRVHYPIPIHLLAPFAQYAEHPLPVAEAAAGEVVSLPLYPHMTDDQIRTVCEAVAVVGELVDRHGGINA